MKVERIKAPLTADELIAFEILRYIRCWKVCGVRFSMMAEPDSLDFKLHGLRQWSLVLQRHKKVDCAKSHGHSSIQLIRGLTCHMQQSPCTSKVSLSSSFSGGCPDLTLRDQLHFEQKMWNLDGPLRLPEPK